MNRKEVIKYQSDSEAYLDQKGVYPLFDALLKSLVISQPNDPIEFLISQLKNPNGKKIFILGPPGGLSQSLCDLLSKQNNFVILQAGQAIEREAQKDEETMQSIKKFTYIPDAIALKIMKTEINKIEANGKTLIIEGFPKTRIQALEWQKMGIIPEAVIVLQMAKDQIIERCLQKIKNGKYEHIKKQDMEELATNYAEEYILNLSQVKRLYNNVFEIEEGMTRSQAEEQIYKLIQYKIYKKIPANQARIFIQGMPGLLIRLQLIFIGSGRTSLAKIIAKKYGITYIAIADLLAQQIAEKTAVGKRVLQEIQNNQLGNSAFLQNYSKFLMKLSQDCYIGGYIRLIAKSQGNFFQQNMYVSEQMNSYVVDGFPKTLAQLNSFKELKIKVSNIIILEMDTTDAFERLLKPKQILLIYSVQGTKIDPKTGIIYNKHTLAKITNDEINLRLYDLQNSTEEQITKRIKRWQTIQKKLKELFEPVLVEINAILPREAIVQKVCDILDHNK